MSDDNAILAIKRRRLRALEEQKARYGLGCPAEIIAEIEDLQYEVAELSGSIAASALPRLPQPDFVHPYPLQTNFTGRVAERKMLTEWLSNRAQSVLAFIAIGGMAKSAPTWVQRDVLGLPLPGATDEPPEVSAACHLPNEAQPDGDVTTNS